MPGLGYRIGTVSLTHIFNHHKLRATNRTLHPNICPYDKFSLVEMDFNYHSHSILCDNCGACDASERFV